MKKLNQAKANNPEEHLFVLWDFSDKTELSWFLAEISNKFSVLDASIILWSDEDWERNLSRLYGAIPSGPNAKFKDIGYQPFLAVVCRDMAPEQGLVQTLSGEVERANLAVVALKREIRQQLGENRCHSTTNIDEFEFQYGLLWGIEKLAELRRKNEWDGELKEYRQSLTGNDGWRDAKQLFQFLNIATRWVVLRNFAALPENLERDDDVDVLVDDLERFTAAANARSVRGGLSRYEIKIAGKFTRFDIRFIGDGYFDILWQNNLLASRKITKQCVPILSDENYFFSLLYHVKIQKKSVDSKYLMEFDTLAKQLKLEEFEPEHVLDDELAASILSGYMRSNKIRYVKPLDPLVETNRQFIRRLKPYALPIPRILLRRKLLNRLRQLLPQAAYMLFPAKIRKLVKHTLDK